MASEDLDAQIRAALRDVGARTDAFTRSDVQAGALVALMQFACATAGALHLSQPELAEQVRRLLEAAKRSLDETEDRDVGRFTQDALLAVFNDFLRGKDPLK